MGATSQLVAALTCTVSEPFIVRHFHPLPEPAASGFSSGTQTSSNRQDEPAGERGLTCDQTNRSVVVGESVVVKWLTPPAPLPQPTPDMFAHLTSVGFTATATPYAAVSRRDDDEGELLLALVTAYLPEAVDGWEWCVDEAVSGGTAFAADLGVLSADLHAAMATPSETFPDPVRTTNLPGRQRQTWTSWHWAGEPVVHPSRRGREHGAHADRRRRRRLALGPRRRAPRGDRPAGLLPRHPADPHPR